MVGTSIFESHRLFTEALLGLAPAPPLNMVAMERRAFSFVQNRFIEKLTGLRTARTVARVGLYTYDERAKRFASPMLFGLDIVQGR
jgi:hypothetical protein